MKRIYFTDKAAYTVGIPAAVLLQYLYEKTEQAREKGERFHEGLYWHSASVTAFSVELPMTVKQIRNALDKLISGGYIVTGNFNDTPYDRTTWYALTDTGRGIVM